MRFVSWTLVMLVGAAGLSAGGCESKSPSTSPAPAASSLAGGPQAAPSNTSVAGGPQAAPSNTSVKLGTPIRAGQKVALASIAKDSAKYANTTVTTEGRVTAVCQAMGCWMEIADTAGEAHVRMSGHSFFIPKTASGRRAIVQGTVLAKPDNGECEQEAAEATGKVVKIELDATGVELL